MCCHEPYVLGDIFIFTLMVFLKDQRSCIVVFLLILVKLQCKNQSRWQEITGFLVALYVKGYLTKL